VEARLSTPSLARPASPEAGGLTREEAVALLALAFLLAVTVLWWMLALAPAAGAPAWVQSARAVCFGAHQDGLPSGGGWLLLIGEPVGMTAALFLVWRQSLVSGLGKLWSGVEGRTLAATVGGLLLVAIGLAAQRVATAGEGMAVSGPPLREVNRPAPELGLVEGTGATLHLAPMRGRPVLVTFAFAHCATVCPLLVHDALEAARGSADAPAVVVVTLDPWRDTPSRLSSIARAWGMRTNEHVLSGEVERVLAVHHAWGVRASRDPRTGEITHAPTTFVLDAVGRIRFVTTGRTDELIEALRRLSAK